MPDSPVRVHFVRGRRALLPRRTLGWVRLLDRDDEVPLGERERLLHGLRDARAALGVRFQPVHDDFDGVLDALIKLQVVGQLHYLPIDAGADVAALHHVREEVLELALLPANDRGENLETRPFRETENAADDLFAGLRRDRPLALRAVTLPQAGVQHPQVVRNFRDRADGTAWVAPGGLLLDADRRRQPADVIDVRFRELPEELAGVAGERLDVPALTFGVDRVERERRLAAAAHAGKDDELVSREFEVYAAQVVFACPTNDNTLGVHMPEDSS